MKQRLMFCGGLALLAGLAGCVTLDDPGPSAEQQENLLILREDLNRVQGQMETVAMENRRLAGEIEKLRAVAADTRDQAAFRERLDSLERQIQAVNAAREKDKQAIVDQLSAKIAELLSKGAGRPTRSPPAPAAAGGAGEGEHIVKPGETLSAIAARYKVPADAILEANGLEDPDRLPAGRKLVIPR